MPVRKTPLVTGETYHVFNRGINKQKIFLDKRDCSYMLEIIEYYQFLSSKLSYSKFRKIAKYKREEFFNKTKKDSNKLVDILAFCIMPNHFHLVLKQKVDEGTSKFLRNIQNSYALYFNIKHQRSGPLFQGRFKSVHIHDIEQLIHLVRYVHLNPSTSHVIDSQEIINYPWSSLPQYLGDNSSFCDTKVVWEYFSSKKDYEKHVMDQVDYQRQLKKIKDLIIEK